MKQNASSFMVRIGSISAWYKLLISLLVTTIIYLFTRGDSRLYFLGLWDIFCFVMLLLALITFTGIDSRQIRNQCKGQDESIPVALIIVMAATIISLGAVILLLKGNKSLFAIITALAGMLLSWGLIHTTFTFRYAHLYYRDDKDDKNVHAGGLEFPSDKKPNYFDFAYFAFVVGMTFQVSDVQITSKRLRKLALFHGILSFLYNTFIVALTVNVIGSFK